MQKLQEKNKTQLGREDNDKTGRRKKVFLETAAKYLKKNERDVNSGDYSATDWDRLAIENSLLLSSSGGGQLYHEQYDEHGVKIEHQCFT